MQPIPLRTVIGSYPFPSWLIFASEHIEQFGPTDIVEMQEDAVSIAGQGPDCRRIGCNYRWGTSSLRL